MRKGNNMVAVVFAAMAGFITGILVAPKSGRETREDLRAKAEDTKRQAREKLETVNRAVQDGTQELKDFGRKSGAEATGLADDAKRRAARVDHEAKKTTHDLQH